MIDTVTIQYIKKIEIEKLWNEFNIEWALNKDVNILAGINGSGKTTILNLIKNNLNHSFNPNHFLHAESINVEFNDGMDKAASVNRIAIPTKDTKELKDYKHVFYKTNYKSENVEMIGINHISTFDNPLKSSDDLHKITTDEITTELDAQILMLQKEYLNYTVNIANRVISAFTNSISSEEQQKITYKKNLFLDTLDQLFIPTGKKVNRNSNELSFVKSGKTISPYMLSSGEKQLIIILLNTLVQDEKPYVMLMDEPEISLHTDWQESLIEIIRKLNNNVQIIIATHSPSIVLSGWRDKIFEVQDIIKNANETEA